MKSKSYASPASKNKGAETSQAGNVAPGGYLCGHKPQRAVATIPNADNANGHEQRLAQGSRAYIRPRALGSHSLPATAALASVVTCSDVESIPSLDIDTEASMIIPNKDLLYY
jgi:hypothetical protein